EMRPGNVDVAARWFEGTLGGDEAVTGGMRLQPADVQVHLLGQAEPMPANLNEVPRNHEGLHVARERRALFPWNIQRLKKLAHPGGMMDLIAHQRENLIA